MTATTRCCSRPDGFMTYGTVCEFVQVLPAKDGSQVVTALCQFEGEDGFGTQNFVIRKSQRTAAALMIYGDNGEVFGEVAMPLRRARASGGDLSPAPARPDAAAARRFPARWDRCAQ